MRQLRDLTLYVVRHGECEHNVEGRYAGWDDSPLTAAGRAQALANGALLAEVAGDLAALDFVASPTHRACVTMELARAAAGLPATGYRSDRRLMEMDYGDHSGRAIAEIRALPDYAAYRHGPWAHVRPGGESQAVLHARVGAFLATLRRDTVLVGHAGSVRMIRGHVLGLTPAQILDHRPPHAGVIRLAAGSETVFAP
ncbi:MAG TPA: histidine phosphatase family protein [Rhizomicrobium sp.]|jgi:broad specificity phosphatase PhoE|nr:histidine phosphatase family protein [Rhizomicrobium sp.]